VTIDDATKLRIEFLARVVEKESNYLARTASRLFKIPFDLEIVKRLNTDDDLSERVEAFSSRFARLQDTMGGKLIPQLLSVLGENKETLIDNLDMAERLGWIPSADEWLAIRQLRNQMVHEYSEDLTVLVSAIQTAQGFVNVLVQTNVNLQAEIKKRGII